MKHLKIAGAAVLAASAVVANATITITPGVTNFTGDENILFNQTGLSSSGSLVQGATNQSGMVVNFNNAGIDLTTPANGQARIEPMNANDTFAALTTGLNSSGATFTSLVVNLKTSFDNGQVTFNVQPVGESTVNGTFDLKKEGENFFGIEATDGETISSVSFTTTVGLLDVQQIRMGGAAPVPEPASMAVIGIGMIGLLARKRRKA